MGQAALPEAVRRARRRLLAVVRRGDPAAADWVEQLVAAHPQAPSVVVLGETNRGKSSLINALLAAPGLSPVDAEVATATYLVLAHGEQYVARACYPGTHQPVRFDVEDLPRWVSAAHPLPEGQLPPHHIEVDAPIPLLQRLRLVDTPGVGGLHAMHGELAAEAAASGTALLFVVDASGPFTATELDFLHRVAERVETVLFALTKTDAFGGWREILAADRALLAEHAPRFATAEFLPVSARMFERADRAPNDGAAAMLREHSGIPALQVRLQELVTGRSAMLAEANALRALATVLGEQDAALSVEHRALTTGRSEAERLRERRDELAVLRRSTGRGWQVRLRGEVQRARVESGHEVARQMRDLQSWFRQAIDAAGRDRLPALPGEVDAALQLVSGRVGATLTGRLARLVDAVLAQLFSAEELAVLRAQVARGVRQPIVLRAPERRAPTAEDRLLVFMGMSGGFGAARIALLPLAGAGALLAPVVLPATIVVGLGAGWWMARTRRHSADKQHMKQWLTEAIADARSTLEQAVSEQLIAAEQQLALALDEALERRVEVIEAQLRELQKAAKLRAGERSARLAEVTRRQREVRAALATADDLLQQLRALR